METERQKEKGLKRMKIPPLKIVFTKDDIKAITGEIGDVLRSGQLSLGPMTQRFEAKLASITQRKFAVAVNSGTSALEIYLRLKNVKGKTVIVPTNTNYATAAAIVFAGGKLKLVDGSLFPSLETIKKAVDEDTVGIVFVHIGGYLSEEIKKIREFCDKKMLFLLEDAAHAHGASLNGQSAGSFGHAAAFSFFPTKVITTGEGGALVLDDEEIYRKALIFRDQGKDPISKKNIYWGNSWRMSEMQAVIGYYQLGRLKEYLKRRNEIMNKYRSALDQFSSLKTFFIKGAVPSGYKFVVVFPTANYCQFVKKELMEKYQIYPGGGVYDVPIHQQPVFQEVLGKGSYPEAERFCTTHLCLPIWSTMEDQEVIYVIESLKKILFNYSS